MSTTEATAQSGGTIYVPAGIKTDYMTVTMWADDPEAFARIVETQKAHVHEASPVRQGDAYYVYSVASWTDGPVHFSVHGPHRKLATAA